MTLRALVFAVCLLLPAPAAAIAADRWQAPLAGSTLRPFSLAADRFARGQHRGVDLGAPRGTAVRAACGGRVSFAGGVPGGGRTVSVRCGRLIATYQQLGSIGVRRGALVLPGARLGTVGRSSDPRTRSSHVHLGARIAASGRYLDPLSLVGKSPPVLPTLPPAARHVRHRVPLGPAPAPQPAGRRALGPAHRPVSQPTTSDQPQPLPWTVWIGLVCVGLALPLGGVLTVRRHRRRRATAPLARATT
jgi:hypothetical protein